VTGVQDRARGRSGPRRPAGFADVADVDPRIEARRAEVRLARLVRRRRQWLAGSVAVTVVAMLYGATRSPLLDVDDVTVRGSARTPAAEVRAASGVRPGDPLADVDAERAVAAVRALPWVDDAVVTRRWSGTVDVAVTERVPAVAVEADDATVALVDARRRVLAVSPAAVAGDLPLVRGLVPAAPGATMAPELDGALAVAGALTPGLRTRVEAVEVVDGELELALRPTGRARLGSVDRLDQKMVALLTLFAQVDLTDLCLVDVRVPAAPGLTRANPCR
jgi:cell division protein FtsQ